MDDTGRPPIMTAELPRGFVQCAAPGAGIGSASMLVGRRRVSHTVRIGRAIAVSGSTA